jgi:hypothetical protein
VVLGACGCWGFRGTLLGPRVPRMTKTPAASTHPAGLPPETPLRSTKGKRLKRHGELSAGRRRAGQGSRRQPRSRSDGEAALEAPGAVRHARAWKRSRTHAPAAPTPQPHPRPSRTHAPAAPTPQPHPRLRASEWRSPSGLAAVFALTSRARDSSQVAVVRADQGDSLGRSPHGRSNRRSRPKSRVPWPSRQDP